MCVCIRPKTLSLFQQIFNVTAIKILLKFSLYDAAVEADFNTERSLRRENELCHFGNKQVVCDYING